MARPPGDCQKIILKLLQDFRRGWLNRFRALRAAWAQATKERQQRQARDEFEVERLDRIRHPEKYRGK
jgi:hypothetical protein